MDMAATGGGKIEGDAHDAADVGFLIVEAVACGPRAGRSGLFPRALVDAAHIFAHRDNVSGGGDVGPDRAGGAKLGEWFERGELAIKVELAAKLIDEAVAARAAEHRPAAHEQVAGEIGDFARQAGAVDGLGGKADEAALVKLEPAIAVTGEQPEHAHRHRHDLDPDAFAEEHADVMDGRRIERRAGNGQRLRQSRTHWLVVGEGQFMDAHDRLMHGVC